MRGMIVILAIMIFLSLFQYLQSQEISSCDSSFACVDTTMLSSGDISSPVEVDTSDKITMGKILLGASALIGLPLTTGFVALSLFPPSFVVMERNGNYSSGIAFETAIGHGDSVRFRFSKKRLIFQYSYLGKYGSRIAIAVTQDVLLKKIGRAGIFGVGFSIGTFGWTNFNSVNTAGIEISAWFGNAMNVPYIFLFPQHHLFVKFRRGFELSSGVKINEINIGFSSSITF